MEYSLIENDLLELNWNLLMLMDWYFGLFTRSDQISDKHGRVEPYFHFNFT